MPNPSFERDSPEAGCPSFQTLGLMGLRLAIAVWSFVAMLLRNACASNLNLERSGICLTLRSSACLVKSQAFRLAHPLAVLRGPFIAKGNIVCACASNMAPATDHANFEAGFFRASLGAGSFLVPSSP